MSSLGVPGAPRPRQAGRFQSGRETVGRRQGVDLTPRANSSQARRSVDPAAFPEPTRCGHGGSSHGHGHPPPSAHDEARRPVDCGSGHAGADDCSVRLNGY